MSDPLPQEAMSQIPANVQRGAALLDKYLPIWRSAVDPSLFAGDFPCNCVICQLVPHVDKIQVPVSVPPVGSRFRNVTHKLYAAHFGHTFRDQNGLVYFEVDHGFGTSGGLIAGSEWAALMDDWRKLLESSPMLKVENAILVPEP